MKIFIHRTLIGVFLPSRSSRQSVRQVLASLIVFHEGRFTTKLVQRQSSFYGLNARSQNPPITARHFERSREISLKQTVGAHGGSSTSLGATCPGILRSRQT